MKLKTEVGMGSARGPRAESGDPDSFAPFRCPDAGVDSASRRIPHARGVCSPTSAFALKTLILVATLGLLSVAFTGCESSGGGGGGNVSGSIYYGVGFSDPWYYGPGYYPPPPPPPPPDRPDRPVKPEQPIARPTPSPRPMPSIPSTPRMGGGGRRR
jgi:hypothetical protein